MREEDFCLFFSPAFFSFHAGKMGQIYQCTNGEQTHATKVPWQLLHIPEVLLLM